MYFGFKSLKEQLERQSVSCNSVDHEGNECSADLIMKLEEEKAKLAEDLELKIQELDEIKTDIQGLKLDVENLQQTIQLLTNENMEMSTKLCTERERSKDVEFNLQRAVEELYARISKVTDEKINLETYVTTLNHRLESIRSKTPESVGDEQFTEYQNKIEKLKTENIELTAIIAKKNKELHSVKESKSLLYDHECMYKDKLAILAEKHECLVTENREMSTDLMDKIEENDMLKEQCDVLKKKISVTSNVQSGDDVEQLRTENNLLKSEIVELKMKVTMLSDENAKFSNNLFQTMEDLDNSQSDNLHSSIALDNPTKETSGEESRESLTNKLITMQDKIDHLTHLNKKLSDLKLPSCSQCAHLKNLNESRRALKLEARILNHKLEDLQRTFDRKCADTEPLKMKANQDLNLSFVDPSLNASFVDGMNVSFVEEKVHHLNNELQTLKDDRDKLSILYQEKCDELEKLHDEDAKADEDGSKSKKAGKNESRIERIQNSIDQVREDIDELKKNSTNFTSILTKFRTEKASLMDEINTLKSINEDLQQKITSDEISAAMAMEKAQILESDLLNMSKEIEEFSVKEKAIKSEKLVLEVEIEDLKADKQSKDILIAGLHKTVDDLNDCISSLKTELDLMTSQKNDLAVSTESIERKYKDELELLQKQYEKLEETERQSREAEKRAILRAKELEADIEKLQTDLTKQETLYKEVQGRVSRLENLLHESENEKELLKQIVQALEVQVTDSKGNLAIKYENEFQAMSKKFEEYTEEFEIKLSKINETLNKYAEENDNLTQEFAKLQDIELKVSKIKGDVQHGFGEEGTLVNDNKKLYEELDTVKECMIRELKSLKDKVNSVNFLNKTANEIFIIFLQALMSKEEEVIRVMRESFEKDKQKLEDEKRQSADSEKRMTLWARELELEIEKLQMDLTKRENMHKYQQCKIDQLEHHLRESSYEIEIYKEKMETFEADYNNLQAEFEKQCSRDSGQEEAVIVAQRKEKEMQEAYKKKEMELQSKITSEKETYEKRIQDLVSSIESYKTKNMELKSNIEGLEANEKQSQNIIEANATELRKNNQTIHRMSIDLEQLTEDCNEMNREVEQKTSRIEDITKLLKNKCDVLSEYKSKLETIMPDYQSLQDQVKERKVSIERCKEKIEKLKMEKEKEIEAIQDKLNCEQIKNVGLNKQLNELNNKNVAFVEELDDLKEKYEQLQHVNAKLERKIRNSTSKLKVEAQMEDLKDLNKGLQSNLEGASNRITELQDSKNKILKELVNLKGQYELLSQENVEIKKTQSRQSLSQEDGRYDALLQEKNKIALELEGKKVLLNQRDKEIKEHLRKIKDLTVGNKELGGQLEEHAAIIRERDLEISNLKDKVYVRRIEKKFVNELQEKLKTLKEESKKLQDQLETYKVGSQVDVRQIQDVKLHNEKVLLTLRKENLELQTKINEYEHRLESKSNSSGSRSVSPAFEVTRRRHSRNEIFNQKRQLETDINENEETCQVLRKKIQELELQLVTKNGQIVALEIQIQSENFPYQQKCRELEELLLTHRKKVRIKCFLKSCILL